MIPFLLGEDIIQIFDSCMQCISNIQCISFLRIPICTDAFVKERERVRVCVSGLRW